MSSAAQSVRLDLFSDRAPVVIPLVVTPAAQLTVEAADDFLKNATGGFIGIAASYEKNKVKQLAFVVAQTVLLVQFGGNGNLTRRSKSALRSLFEATMLGFQLDRVAIHLQLLLKISIIGVDLQFNLKPSRRSLVPISEVLAKCGPLNKDKLTAAFSSEKYSKTHPGYLVNRAWAAWMTLESSRQNITAAKRIDMSRISPAHFEMLAKTLSDADRLDGMKPNFVKNQISKDPISKDPTSQQYVVKKGEFQVQSDRFTTRVRKSGEFQAVRVKFADGEVHGHTKGHQGRIASITLKKAPSSAKVLAVITIGKDDATSAEDQISSFILRSCQSDIYPDSIPFIKHIWFTVAPPTRSNPIAFTNSDTHNSFLERLNASQLEAVRAMSQRDNPVTIIQGPPGSGKTSTIAAFVQCQVAANRPVWLVAQSNVAVKNIAEKLADLEFWDFRILVSHEFHFDWHEHLYEKLSRNVIRSDDFPKTAQEVERKLAGSTVILCTLSMICNPSIRQRGFAKNVPVETVVVDEASQIQLGDYVPLFLSYQSTLRKVCFIGDDKQLAPYGQDDIKDLRSIFELDHLRKDIIFLDIQYRMPIFIGEFISRHVYDGLLRSQHTDKTRSCCVFVDVNGQEAKEGHSSFNMKEVHTILHIVKQLEKYGKSFRIITPYDAQRNKLEAALKQANLPWENKCFNVDSFQGNEDDYIVLSVVKTEKLGFLNNERRTNVMLSRCKERLIICTRRSFLQGVAADSLVGKMAKEWGPSAWRTTKEVLNGRNLIH